MHSIRRGIPKICNFQVEIGGQCFPDSFMLDYISFVFIKCITNQFRIMAHHRTPSLVQSQWDDILDNDDVSDLSDDSDSDHDYIFSDSSSSSGEEAGEIPSPRKHPSVVDTSHNVPWLSNGSRKRSINHITTGSELPSSPPAKRGRGRPRGSSQKRGRGRGRARGRPPGFGRGSQTTAAPSQTAATPPDQWQWAPTCDFSPPLFDMDQSYEDISGCTNPELTQNSSRIEFWRSFMTPSLTQQIVSCSNTYAEFRRQNTVRTPHSRKWGDPISVNEMHTFLALVMLQGIVKK